MVYMWYVEFNTACHHHQPIEVIEKMKGGKLSSKTETLSAIRWMRINRTIRAQFGSVNGQNAEVRDIGIGIKNQGKGEGGITREGSWII